MAVKRVIGTKSDRSHARHTQCIEALRSTTPSRKAFLAKVKAARATR